METLVNIDEAQVAILLATYNGEKYIREQIESLLTQKEIEAKIYIHDDFSTDDTKKIVEKISDEYPGRIVMINSAHNLGVVKSYQFLLDNVEAEFYFFSDQDDVWDERKVEKEIKKIELQEEIPIMVYSDLSIVDAQLNVISESMFRKMNVKNTNEVNKLLVQNVITGNTVAFNRKLRDLIVFNFRMDSQAVRMHDGWLGLVASAYGKLEFIDSPTVQYRQHGNNVVGAKKVGIVSKILDINNMNKSVVLMMEQAKLLENKMAQYPNKSKKGAYKIIFNYSKMLTLTKWKRIQILSKYHIKKQGKLRNIGYLVLILVAKRETHV